MEQHPKERETGFTISRKGAERTRAGSMIFEARQANKTVELTVAAAVLDSFHIVESEIRANHLPKRVYDALEKAAAHKAGSATRVPHRITINIRDLQ